MATASTCEAVFPEVDRVIYGKAPLIEVICQVRFPADLRLEKDPPADFQQRIRSSFPLLKRTEQRAFPPGMPPEIAKAFEAVGPGGGSETTWVFATEDGAACVELTKEKLTQISRKYEQWEAFYGSFSGLMSALMEIYSPPFLTRVGLRYRDLIRRSALGLEDVGWNELLADHVLGELGVSGVREGAIEAARNLVLRLPERDGRVRLQHGFAEAEGSNEQCYLIDCDFFVGRTEVNDAESTINYLHDHAGRYFRWCIKDRLHEAMEPHPISD